MPNSPIKLLVIGSSRDDTETYISTLRNAGMAVHADRVEREQALIDALGKTELDIILCSCTTKNIEPSRVQELCTEAKPGIPFILLCQDMETCNTLTTMGPGIRDFIPKDAPRRLQLTVARELGDLQIRRQLEELKHQLQESEDRCTALVQSSQDPIAYIYDGMHIRANPAYLKMFGSTEMEDIEGLPILDIIAPEQHKKFKVFLRSLSEKAGTAELDITCQNNDGNTFDAKLEFTHAAIDDEPCTQVVIRDQSRDKALKQKIHQLNLQDLQTGLYNRLFFTEQLDKAMQHIREPDGCCCLLYIIIDNFSTIRSSVGIAASDAILKTIADTLKGAITGKEVLARFGDHSFTILSQRSAVLEAEELATHICSALDEQFIAPLEQGVRPTCSIGIAYSEGQTSSPDFINHAYFASETAHKNGGNQIATYDANAALPSYEDTLETEQEESEHDLALDQEQLVQESEADIEALISRALKEDRVRLVYQPVVSLQGDSRENYAVMARILDNNDQEILPDYFLEEAEQTGQMAEVDHWIIKHAIQTLAQQRKEGHKINFFITISSASIADPTTLLMICDSMRGSQVKGAWLTFQIRDADLRTHTREAKKLIEGLKKIKCQIALTHFGLAPKPETVLKNLPFDFVKLDISFVEDLATSQEKQDALNEINQMIQDHNIKTIATAVEDANSLAVLWTVGINYIQGYFLQEPSDSIAYDFSSN